MGYLRRFEYTKPNHATTMEVQLYVHVFVIRRGESQNGGPPILVSDAQ